MIAQLDPDYLAVRLSKVLGRLISYGLFEGRPLTTRGRFINPLVFRNFALADSLSVNETVDRPIFILGTGRSGSTILGVVLSTHRDVGFLNEPKALWHYVCPHEDVIGNYTRSGARYRLTAADADDVAVRRANRVIGWYLRVVRASRLVDKYPELVFRVPFVKKIFPSAQFLLLVRRGADTVASIQAWSREHGMQSGREVQDWWGANDRKWRLLLDELVAGDPALGGMADRFRSYTSHLDRAAVEWSVTMREGLRVAREHPDSVHVVRYEDLVERPSDTLTRIFDSTGLRPDAGTLEYARRVLRVAPPRPLPDLDAAVRPLFEQTSRELGY